MGFRTLEIGNAGFHPTFGLHHDSQLKRPYFI